jgi:hypothetical protein
MTMNNAIPKHNEKTHHGYFEHCLNLLSYIFHQLIDFLLVLQALLSSLLRRNFVPFRKPEIECERSYQGDNDRKEEDDRYQVTGGVIGC